MMKINVNVERPLLLWGQAFIHTKPRTHFATLGSLSGIQVDGHRAHTCYSVSVE